MKKKIICFTILIMLYNSVFYYMVFNTPQVANFPDVKNRAAIVLAIFHLLLFYYIVKSRYKVIYFCVVYWALGFYRTLYRIYFLDSCFLYYKLFAPLWGGDLLPTIKRPNIYLEFYTKRVFIDVSDFLLIVFNLVMLFLSIYFSRKYYLRQAAERNKK